MMGLIGRNGTHFFKSQFVKQSSSHVILSERSESKDLRTELTENVTGSVWILRLRMALPCFAQDDRCGGKRNAKLQFEMQPGLFVPASCCFSALWAQDAVGCQKGSGNFCKNPLRFRVVTGRKLCYNDCN